ncbi:MAG: FAD-binding oxidoreductase [Candidatus Nanopelagicales bacterium]
MPDDMRSLARWGADGDAPVLSAQVRDFLSSRVGQAVPWQAADPESWQVAPSRVAADVVADLASAVGAQHVSDSRADRLRATGGAAFIDYARRRAGIVDDAPDVVVSPGSHDEVLAVLACARRHRLAVLPVGGGTSVVGGLRTDVPRVALQLTRLGRLLHLDEVSGIATVGPAITGPVLEALLGARGFTLGHLPQSWQRATIGGYVATRSAGQASTGYGRSDDMVESLRVATPDGTLDLGRAPSTAAGPDLRGLIIGSEGAFGVITEVRLRVRRAPTTRIYDAAVLPGFAPGVEAFRDAIQSRAGADVMRLSDEAETSTTLLMSGPRGLAGAALERYLRARHSTTPARAILGWEGTDRELVRARRAATWRALRRHGGVSLGHGPGESWRRHRFDGPHLRDSLMDAGYLVETLETATHWSDYLDLHARVTDTLGDSLTTTSNTPYVMSHLSHSYDTGASLYTTVIAVADHRDPVAQWMRAKTAVTQAIVDAGATITHHHAVGRDHAPWLKDEVGPLGVSLLRAAKSAVDPDDTLNPGVLGL